MAERDEATPDRADASDEQDAFKGLIALSLAALIVLGAGLAILQVDASGNESNTARETTRTAVAAMRANVVASTAAGVQPVAQAERDFLAYRPPFAPGEPSLASATVASPATTGSLRVAQQQVPDLGLAALVPKLSAKAERLTLRQSALARTRITWNDRSTQYTTVIAVLAVAIFLVGFALVVKGPIRRAAYSLGIAVGFFAGAWAVWVHQLPIPVTPERAITATARGNVLTDAGDYTAAITRYGAALRADGSYAPAYTGRARARLLVANPDYPVTRAVTDVSSEATLAAANDVQHALALNSRNLHSMFLFGLLSFYGGDDVRAVAATEAAIAVNPKVPDLWLLKSAAELAGGDTSAATAALTRALAPLRATDPSQRMRLLASTYLSYLAFVEHTVPVRASAAQALTNRVVATETAFTLGRALPAHPPATGRASVRRLRYAKGMLRLRLTWKDLPRGTALSAIGYERPRPNAAWAQPSALALFAGLSGSGRRDIAVPLQRVCQPAGVRVDVSLNATPAFSRIGPGVAPTC